MDIEVKTWLLDIHQSIDEIFLFLGDSRDFIAYKADLKTKKAVERNLEIIGEIAGLPIRNFFHTSVDKLISSLLYTKYWTVTRNTIPIICTF